MALARESSHRPSLLGVDITHLAQLLQVVVERYSQLKPRDCREETHGLHYACIARPSTKTRNTTVIVGSETRSPPVRL